MAGISEGLEEMEGGLRGGSGSESNNSRGDPIETGDALVSAASKNCPSIAPTQYCAVGAASLTLRRCATRQCGILRTGSTTAPSSAQGTQPTRRPRI